MPNAYVEPQLACSSEGTAIPMCHFKLVGAKKWHGNSGVYSKARLRARSVGSPKKLALRIIL